MFEFPIIGNIPYDSLVSATNNSGDFLWIFFIVVLIIGGIILGALLLSFSTKPNDWEHIPLTEEVFPGGKLNGVANSINYSSDQNDYSPLKNQIEVLFFEKVRATSGMSPEEIFEMKNRDPNRLRDVIRDKEISDWIFNVRQKEEKKGFFDFLRSDKEEKKQKYISEINSILDRMEAWGE